MKKESRAIPKMCGLETELGVMLKSAVGSSIGGHIFVEGVRPEWIFGAPKSTPWDPSERILRANIPESMLHSFFYKQMWQRYLNFFLPNGARLYVDIGPHTEISSPISSDPRMLVIWNRACYRWIDILRRRHQETGKEFRVFRNNVSGDETYQHMRSKGFITSRSSWACHENYTVSRTVPEHDLIRKDIPWFVYRILFAGAGKVGGDYERALPDGSSRIVDVDFQISQRADFFTDLANIETSWHRPIHNTRDVPYADENKFRRVHVIPGDSNMLELPEYLKVGLTSIIYMMIEDGVLDDRFEMSDPVSAFHEISWDISLKKRVWLINQKRSRRPIDCLRDYCDLFGNYLSEYHPDNRILRDVVERFARVLDTFRNKHWQEELWGWIDWVTKKFFIESALAKKGKTWNDALALRLDCEYHDNDHERGIFYTKIFPTSERVTSDAEIEAAVREAPPTRARFMVESVRRHSPEALSSDFWHKITFAHEGRFFVLSLGDPAIVWKNEFLEGIVNRPFAEFLEAAKTIPGAKVDDFVEVAADEEKTGHGLRVEDTEKNIKLASWTGMLYEQLVKRRLQIEAQRPPQKGFTPTEPFESEDDWWGS